MHPKITTTVANYYTASGPIDYGFTNDYMFRVVLERNMNVLKGLTSSLLHIPIREISNIIIKNPILNGESPDSKEYILDIHILLNNSRILNLEMQVINEKNWPERSLSYLCRCFDNVYRGQDYSEVMPVHHIGFLDFNLFQDIPKFFSTYHLTEDTTGHIFTSKFVLSVIDLTHIELATDADKSWNIDKWSALFKAKTWEEIRMIASNNQNMQSAAKSLFILNGDQLARERARAREDAIAREQYFEKTIARQASELSEKDNTIKEKDNTITTLLSEIEALKKQLDNQ